MLSVLFTLSFSRILDNTDFWIIEMSSHFPFQYALISFAVLSVSVWKKKGHLSVLSGFLFVFNVSAIMDFEKSILAAGQTDTSFTVYSANINKDNKGLSDLKNELKAINPDIVLLMEVSPKHFEELDSVKLSYPYSVENVQNGLLGVVFLSRFPVRNHQFTKLSDFGNLLLEAMLDIDQTTVMFYGIHAQRPDRGDFNERKRQFYGPAEQIRDKSLPAIVAGDFNATPFSPLFRELVRIAELKDSREGFGWQPSWPSFFPLLWIPIDHVLVTPDFQVRKRSTGSHIGSDHYPVIAELSLG